MHRQKPGQTLCQGGGACRRSAICRQRQPLFGALEFALSRQVLPGFSRSSPVQLAVTPEDPRSPRALPRRRTSRPPDQLLVLLVKDECGYRNLLRLVSRSYLGGGGRLRAAGMPIGSTGSRSQRRAHRANRCGSEGCARPATSGGGNRAPAARSLALKRLGRRSSPGTPLH